jgi:Bacterial Ig-like domain (group 3)
VLTSLTISHTTVGLNADVLVGLVGSGFVPDSRVLWRGLSLVTTYNDPTSLDAVVPADKTATAGEFSISVSNPDGGSTAGQPFIVGNPVPHISSIIPNGLPVAPVTPKDTVLIINGTGFLPNSAVSWGGTLLTTVEYRSATELNATVPASYLKKVDAVKISVINSGPDGGPSKDNPTFTVAKLETTVKLDSPLPVPSWETAEAVPLIATVSIVNATIPTSLLGGTVTFKNAATNAVLDVVPLGNFGTANLNYRFPAGTVQLQAIYDGDATFDTSTSASASYIIAPAKPVITLSPPLTSTYGQSVSFVASVNAANTTPSIFPTGGSIQFTLNGLIDLGTVPYNVLYSGAQVNSPLTSKTALTVLGPNIVTAIYLQGNDTNYLSSDPATPVVQVITPLIPIVTLSASSGSTSNYGTSVTLNATVTSGAGSPLTGTVSFADDRSGSLGFGNLTAGQASVNHILLDAAYGGVHNLVATFTSLDSNFGNASGAFQLTINPIPLDRMTLTCGTDTFGNLISEATMYEPSGPFVPPTGSVIFDVENLGLAGSRTTTSVPMAGRIATLALSTVSAINPISSKQTIIWSAQYAPDTASNYLPQLENVYCSVTHP